MLAGLIMVVGCDASLACQLIMVCDLPGESTHFTVAASVSNQRLGHPFMERPAPHMAGLIVDQATQLLMAKIVDQRLASRDLRDLLDDSMRDQIFEAGHDLLLAPAA